ncbi:unnamed protein product [Psylliodes chrysocephalus]|uniref:C-type lectin domain-containing protein n=1 Tax=Psylliodes chrysocephalus TaxID=3402493 RepID=A0A9P0CV82_9CUCU|nr:unnamed protein product [Psylliodes chrysocephala]
MFNIYIAFTIILSCTYVCVARVPNNIHNDVKLNKAESFSFKLGQKEYTVVPQTDLNLMETLLYCNTIGQRALTIQSEEENNALFNLLYPKYDEMQFWTSGYKTNNAWFWLTTGAAVNLSKWTTAFPNDDINYNMVLTLREPEPSADSWWAVDSVKNTNTVICESSV